MSEPEVVQMTQAELNAMDSRPIYPQPGDVWRDEYAGTWYKVWAIALEDDTYGGVGTRSARIEVTDA